MIEAKAASVYWRSWRDLGLIERKGGNLPASWRRFAQRNKRPEISRQQTRGAPYLGHDKLLRCGRSWALSAGAESATR
jgi:hypothetical protein